MQWTRRAMLRALGASAAWPVLSQLGGCGGAAAGERVAAPTGRPLADIRSELGELTSLLSRDYAEARAMARVSHRAVAAADASDHTIATDSVAAAVFTVLDGGAAFESATADLSSEGLRRAAAQLRRPRRGARARRRAVAVPSAAREYAVGARVNGAVEDAALATAADIHRRSRKFGGSRVVYRAAHAAITEMEVVLVGGGQDLHQRLRRAVAGATFVARLGAAAIAETVSHAGAFGADAVAVTDAELHATASRLLELLHAQPAPTGSFDVVLDPTVAALLIGSGVAPALTADTWVAGRSRAAGLVGRAVAAAQVTVVDDPARADGFASYAFDDEGQPGERTLLIDGGVLRGPLTDRATAAALALPRTGHGRRGDPLAPVSPRPSNVSLLPGKTSSGELVTSVDRGLLIEGGLSARLDPRTWRIGIHAARAREIRNGRWTGRRYRGIALSADVPALLSKVVGLSDAVMWTPSAAAGGAACAVGVPFVRTHAHVVGIG